MPGLALQGLKVLDIGRYFAGPYCAKMLADLGADVIKVEPPGGDPARRLGPFPDDRPNPEGSGTFMYFNSNKKGLTLNLKTETGKNIFKRLVEQVDVVIENFSPRVMPSLGLDFKTLRAVNDRLVMTSISNFGQTGPYRDFKASDIGLQALAGWLQTRGTADGWPLRAASGIEVTALIGAVYAASGTLAAHAQRVISGTGNHVDVSIAEAATLMMSYPIAMASFPNPGWLHARRIQVPGVEECKDGYVGLNVLTSAQLTSLWKMMGVEDLLENPDYQTKVGRANARDLIKARMRPWLMSHTQEEILSLGQALGIPVAPIYETSEMIRSPQFQARQYFSELEHPLAGHLTQPGAPFKMSASPWQIRSLAPTLGQHNSETYCELLGYSKCELVLLRQSGVI